MSGRMYGRAAGDETEPQSLRQELRDAPGFSGTALLLAVGGSVVGTILTTATGGAGPWGSLAGAAIGPVVSTVFSTRVTGEHGRVRAVAVAILSLGALVITLTGLTVTEKAAGKPVLPGAEARSSTFDLAAAVGGVAPQSTSEPGVVGPGPAPVTPPPPTTEPTPSTGLTDTCMDGFVWREAVPGDLVCVLPETRDRAAADNAAAAERRDPAGGEFGPDTCLPGFVWREAVPGDLVCVPPETRDQAAADNAAATDRRGP